MDSTKHLLVSHLICPAVRTKHHKDFPRKKIGVNTCLVINNPYNKLDVGDDCSSNSRHHLYPLYWCNNKKSEHKFECGACDCEAIGTTYYFCNECDFGYHKECVESPPLIKSPYHPKHHLQLLESYGFGDDYDEEMRCYYCGSDCGSCFSYKLFYCCSVCKFSMDPICVKKPTFVNYTKRHEHTLNHFPRKTHLICDVCGVVDSKSPIFVCLQCDFIVHNNCIYLPFVIRISRHDHRISFTYSSPSKNMSCRVCRQNIGENYGKYSCMKDCTYHVHPKCATRADVWDGQELEDKPEEVYEILPPFEVIGDGIIQHFSHPHHMRFEKWTSMLYDRKKHCEACALPFYDGDGYECMDLNCGFALHEACANLPRTKRHMGYPNLLTLQVRDTGQWSLCKFCCRSFFGFKYVCSKLGYDMTLDVLCAEISEPFDHPCHIHPLFLTNELKKSRPRFSTKPQISKPCSMCRTDDARPLNCIKCDFVMCFRCVTLPYKARYEHDEHFLTLSYEENLNLLWCEVCEGRICSSPGWLKKERLYPSPEWIYTCNECGITLHIGCLLEINKHHLYQRWSYI